MLLALFFLFSVTWQLKASKDPFNLGDVRSANLCFAAGFGLSNALRSKEAPTRKGESVFPACALTALKSEDSGL